MPNSQTLHESSRFQSPLARRRSDVRDHTYAQPLVTAESHPFVETPRRRIHAHHVQKRDLVARELKPRDFLHQPPGEPASLKGGMRADAADLAQRAGMHPFA